MEKIVLFGNASMAKSAYFALNYDPRYKVVAFTVDREYITEDTLFGLPVVPFTDVESIYPPDEYKMRITVGYVKVNKLRAERYFQAKEMGYQLVSYISSLALISPEVVIGDNCGIGANCLISSFVEIGNDVNIAPGSTIGHDTVVKDHCFISDRVVIGGGVTVEPYCFIGLNSTIRNRVTIARECVIGAGSVILQDTQEKQVYMARPADLLPITSDKLPVR